MPHLLLFFVLLSFLSWRPFINCCVESHKMLHEIQMWMSYCISVRQNHEDFGSLTVHLFLYSLLLFLVFVFYSHAFNYSFRVMNQSQTNTPRSEVISWTSFLTHSSSKRQVLYCWFWFCSAALMVVHLLQKCSRASPAGRQAQKCYPLAAAAPAFLFLPFLIICFAICTRKNLTHMWAQCELSANLQQFCTNLKENPETSTTSLGCVGVSDAQELSWTGAQGSPTSSLYVPIVSPMSVPLSTAMKCCCTWAPHNLRYFFCPQFFSFLKQPQPMHSQMNRQSQVYDMRINFYVIK